MNIVLTCIGNFQEYILVNIQQLIRLGHKSIYIITNREYFEKFSTYDASIYLIAVESLNDTYNYNATTQLDNQFRGGFWALTSARFFYLYEFIRKYSIENVIHLENDVLIYYNTDVLYPLLDTSKIYLPFDTFQRNIASIMFIPNALVFKTALDLYDLAKNDMENFAIIQRQTNIIENFPIFINDSYHDTEHQFVSKNFNQFQYIFDAAAIGQYLGGVDPRNIPGNTIGFINETCVIKYNAYSFIWKEIDNISRPFIRIRDDYMVPIFNLHIHSKALENFVFQSDNTQKPPIGIVITRHVRCENTNKVWNECYRCIRKWYPDNIIMIIDDNSNYDYVISESNLINCFIIQSEFPGAGELLGYYYFHKYHLFDTAIVIHDSSFLNSRLLIDDIQTARFIWHFSHEWNAPTEELALISVLNHSETLVNVYNNTNLWKGCFGTQSVITFTFLDSIVHKYNLFRLFTIVNHSNARCNLERIFGLLCCIEDPNINTNSSIMGFIHDCEDFGTVSFDRYKTCFSWYAHLPIIKSWTGR